MTGAWTFGALRAFSTGAGVRTVTLLSGIEGPVAAGSGTPTRAPRSARRGAAGPRRALAES